MTALEFLEHLPEKVNKDAVHGMNTTFHFNLEGEGGRPIDSGP